MQVIIFNNPNTGILSVVNTSPEWEMLEETLDQRAKKVVPDGTPYAIVDSEVIPNNVQLRLAFSANIASGTVDILCDKAKDIALASLRRRRIEQFNLAGVPVQLAPELEAAILSGMTKSRLQFLRSITDPLKAIDAGGIKNNLDVISQISAYFEDAVFSG